MNIREQEIPKKFSSEDNDYIKVGNIRPGEHMSEILHDTHDGSQVRVSGFDYDPEDSDGVMATMYTYNPQTGDAEVQHGRISGAVREASQYIWERKRETAATVGGVVISVVLGSLWVRHRKK